MKTVTVCVGSSCHLKGSYQVVQSYQKLIKQEHLEDKLTLKASFCQGQCKGGIAVTFEGEYLPDVSITNCEQVFRERIMPELD